MLKTSFVDYANLRIMYSLASINLYLRRFSDFFTRFGPLTKHQST